ncbi:hypothetical protein ACSBR1_042074 [Camellia fascicularis]
MHKIAVGIARGLEYLHHGCTTRIFHFDIKPHNILPDEDFCPKISDFGLPKLCSKKESIVSMLHARGTIGYIAPEVFSRNFGRVWHKADVYSYGMLVLEMVHGRENIGKSVEHTSDLYFPHSIYKKLECDGDIELHGIESEENEKVARKMILVSLCCIQANPSDRPAINKLSNHLDHLCHLIIRVKPKTRVNKLMKFLILNLINRHIRQINFVAMPCNVHSWLRRYKLNQNNPKAINVTFISKLVAVMVLGVHITRSTLWGRGHMGHISWEKTRKSKISNFNAKAIVEQDVVSFDVAVNDVRSMEVSQRASGFECNVHSCSPREGTGFCEVAMEVISDSAIGDVFIDEEELAAVAGAAAVERDEVWVAEADDENNSHHKEGTYSCPKPCIGKKAEVRICSIARSLDYCSPINQS